MNRATTIAAFLGLALTALFVGAGGAGVVVWLAPGLRHLWLDQNLGHTLAPPGSPHHLLGSDAYGRDVGWRLLAGTGVSFLVSLIVTAITIPLGLILGTTAGYARGRWEQRISALSDLIWTFPLMLVVVIATGAIGQGLAAIIVGVSAVSWAGFARVVRAQVDTLQRADFVRAARLLGVPEQKLLRTHVLPHLSETILVMAPYYASLAILTEAAFAFIGFGAQPPNPSLGNLLADGRNYWSVSESQELIPGITLCLIVIGLNLLGDTLRDRSSTLQPQRRATATLFDTIARN